MKNIFENEEEQGPGSWIAADKDIVVIPQGSSTVEDAVKALEDKSNYGIYLSNIRTGKVTPKDMEEFFGPSSPRGKQAIEKRTGVKFPVKTKAAIDDFIKNRAGKPNLVFYDVVDGTLVFPNSKNTSKGRTQSIVATVLDNAGIDYTIKQKESFKESQIKAMIREEIRNILKENFESFDNLESAIKHHEKGDGYYDRTRLKTIFNQLKASDQQKARTKYSKYFGK
jgi:hypothetical protein